MSDKALKDLNALIGSERKNDGSSKQSCIKPQDQNTDENKLEKNCNVVTPAYTNGDDIASAGPEVGNSEVEYIETENLNDLEHVDESLKSLLAGLGSKDWVVVCEALNNVRRLSKYHKEAMCDMLGDVVLLIVKSLKNPRSAVCKTAIMTSADLFKAYSDCVVDFMDPMLVQLLLKSSQDKRFVCEAAEKALMALTTWVPSVSLLPKLEPYLKNRNPRVRAKASMCFCWSVARLGVEGIKAYGIDKLIQIAASQLCDQLPESREAARTLLLKLQVVFERSCNPASTTLPDNEKSSDPVSTTVPDNEEVGSWENFCLSKLSPLSAQAVLRVTTVAREGLVLGS